MAKIARRPKDTITAEDLAPLLMEFREHKTLVADVTTRLDAVKGRLMSILERHGERDEKGSLWLHFEQPVAGYKALKRERRSSLHLDLNRAEAILRDIGAYQDCVDVDITIDASKMEHVIQVLKDAGVYDEVVTVTERLSDDKIMQLYFAEKQAADQENRPAAITDEDIDAMFVESVSWAFKPQ